MPRVPRKAARTAVQYRAVVQSRLRRQRMDQLGVHYQVAAEHQDGARVVGGAAIVGRREQRDQLARSKALEACGRRERV